MAHEINLAIGDFVRIGVGAAQTACELRRMWLEGQIGAAWLASEIGPTRPVKSDQEARIQIAAPFATFALPPALSVVIHPGAIPGAPVDCPAVCRRHVSTIEFSAGNMEVHWSTISLSARQVTFHELIHVAGDPPNQADDNDPHMNWAGVGGLMRATEQPPQRIDIVDGRPVRG